MKTIVCALLEAVKLQDWDSLLTDLDLLYVQRA